MNLSFKYVRGHDPNIYKLLTEVLLSEKKPAAKNIVKNSLMKNSKALQNEKIIYSNAIYWYLSGDGFVSMTRY